MGNEASMPCASSRGDPSCSSLLDCNSSRTPVPLNRQPNEFSAPQRGVSRLGGRQPAGATFTAVGERAQRGGRENGHANVASEWSRHGHAHQDGRKAFAAAGAPERSQGSAPRPVMDLQEQRRRQLSQMPEKSAEERGAPAIWDQQVQARVQARAQAQHVSQRDLAEPQDHDPFGRTQLQRDQMLQEEEAGGLRAQTGARSPSGTENEHRMHEEEPHWVGKVQQLSRISPLFPLTMAPPADHDFFLYPHLDYENKRDPQQRRPMMPREPGAVDRRKTAAEEHEEMVLALQEAIRVRSVKLTQDRGGGQSADRDSWKNASAGPGHASPHAMRPHSPQVQTWTRYSSAGTRDSKSPATDLFPDNASPYSHGQHPNPRTQEGYRASPSPFSASPRHDVADGALMQRSPVVRP